MAQLLLCYRMSFQPHLERYPCAAKNPERREVNRYGYGKSDWIFQFGRGD